MDLQEILAEAKRRYLPETKCNNRNLGYLCDFTITKDTDFKLAYHIEDGIIAKYCSNGTYTIYKNGEWATIVSSPKPKQSTIYYY